VVFIEVEDKRLTIGQKESMNTDEILKYPASSGILHRFAGLMGKGLSLGLQPLTNAVLQGGIDPQAPYHHPHQGPEALGGFKIQ
jgi:hypothetical protein